MHRRGRRAVAKLAAVVGNSGAGKTTLARLLCREGPFAAGLEEHETRPYQRQFSRGERSAALPNQMDYLLLRAEQELNLRRGESTAVVDGGLELDYQVFTRYFHARGYLDEAGFQLCTRLYRLAREALPPPDLILWLRLPVETAARRLKRRARRVEVAGVEDLEALESYLQAWLAGCEARRVLQVDASPEDPDYRAQLPELLARIRGL